MPAVTADTLTLPRLTPMPETTGRPVTSVTTAPTGFEGEGFPVHRAFAGVPLEVLDPFIHMDQMGEVEYAAGEPKGTPWHPHRGFETFTYLIDGEFIHQDSNGGGGTIGGGGTHLLFKFFNIGAQIMADHVLRPIPNLDCYLIARGDMGDDIADILFDRFGRDAIGFVIGKLLGATAIGFVDRAFHAARHPIRIEDHAAIDIAGGAANCLDERGFRPEEPFLVGIQNADQTAFGNVEAFA